MRCNEPHRVQHVPSLKVHAVASNGYFFIRLDEVGSNVHTVCWKDTFHVRFLKKHANITSLSLSFVGDHFRCCLVKWYVLWLGPCGRREAELVGGGEQREQRVPFSKEVES